jgi:competence protein ComEC
MKIWHQYPFIRLVLPFIAGIVAAISLNFSLKISILPFISLILLLFGLMVFAFAKKISYSQRWLNGVVIHLLLFCSGYEVTRLNTLFLDKDNISHFKVNQSAILVQVIEPVNERPNSYKVIARVILYKDSIQAHSASGKLILYFEKDTTVQQIKYGDQLLVHTSLNPVNPPMNPGEFNYKRYLSNRGIYNQGFVKTGSWQIVGFDKGNFLKAYSLKVRNKFLHILEANQIKGDEFAVASALLLGCTDYLDADQMKSYAGSGAMHILSVSGLHVGIIYLFLNTLLWFLNKKRSTRIIKVFLMILLIWMYALITGFSPSVLRSSLMFTILIFGELLIRRVNTYNTLAASALILLFIWPYLIFDVGFQLSYLAVFGIVWLYRPISNLITPSNRIIRFIWQTTAVSIAATIVTFPITIYYFRQFPNLFLVTNLIAVPVSTLIIYTGIGVLAFSPVQFLSSFLALLMTKMIWFMNTAIRLIEEQPFAVTRGIHINTIEMVILSALLITILSYLMVKTKRYFNFALSLLVVFYLSVTYRHVSNHFHKKIVAYSINKATAIDFIDGLNGMLLTDSLVLNDNSKFSYHIQNHRIIAGIDKLQEGLFDINQNLRQKHLYKNGNFILYYDKSLLLVDQGFDYQPTQSKLPVNYLILSHDPTITINDLSSIFSFEMIIIDQSNSFWKTNKWIMECEQSGIRYHSMRTAGAWEMQI